MSYPTFERPFPALTPAQRYHLEVLGYVVVENTLNPEEIGELKEALHKLDRELERLDDPTAAGPRCLSPHQKSAPPFHRQHYRSRPGYYRLRHPSAPGGHGRRADRR